MQLKQSSIVSMQKGREEQISLSELLMVIILEIFPPHINTVYPAVQKFKLPNACFVKQAINNICQFAAEL